MELLKKFWKHKKPLYLCKKFIGIFDSFPTILSARKLKNIFKTANWFVALKQFKEESPDNVECRAS